MKNDSSRRHIADRHLRRRDVAHRATARITAAPLARRGYRVHLVDPVPLHVEQARQAAGSDPAFGFTAAEGDARELAERAGSQDAVLLSGPLCHLTGKAQRRQALAGARRVLRRGGRLLAMGGLPVRVAA